MYTLASITPKGRQSRSVKIIDNMIRITSPCYNKKVNLSKTVKQTCFMLHSETRALQERRPQLRQLNTLILPMYQSWRVSLAIQITPQIQSISRYMCRAKMKIPSKSSHDLLRNGQISDWTGSMVIPITTKIKSPCYHPGPLHKFSS